MSIIKPGLYILGFCTVFLAPVSIVFAEVYAHSWAILGHIYAGVGILAYATAHLTIVLERNTRGR
jgi:hypothetical protein